MSKRAREKLRRRLADVEDVARGVRDTLAEALDLLSERWRSDAEDEAEREAMMEMDVEKAESLIAQAHEQLEQFGLGDGDPDRDDALPVCGGCLAVGPEPHASDCPDERIRLDQEERRERGEGDDQGEVDDV